MAHLFALLCILCLHFTCTHCVDVCGSIRTGIDTLLAIGPWKRTSQLIALTTDLQLVHGTMTERDSDASTLRLSLNHAGSLSFTEPLLYGILHKQMPTASVNLIEIEYNQGRRFLLQSQVSTWQIEPSSGQPVAITSDPASGGVWYSTDTNNWATFDRMVIRNFYLNENQIKVGDIKYLDNTVDENLVKLTASKPEKPSKVWPVKKAFRWKGNLYFLTSETVYIFNDNTLTSEAPVKLTKVAYSDFFVCNVTKPGENAVKDISKDMTDGRQARGSSKPSSSPWLLIGILLLVGGLILGLAVFYLRRGGKAPKVESSGHLKDKSAYRSRRTAASSGHGHGRPGSPYHGHGSTAHRHRAGSGQRKTPHTRKKAHHSPAGTMLLGPTLGKPSPTKTTLHGPVTGKASKTTLISPRATGKNGRSSVKASSSSFQKIATRWNTTVVK